MKRISSTAHRSFGRVDYDSTIDLFEQVPPKAGCGGAASSSPPKPAGVHGFNLAFKGQQENRKVSLQGDPAHATQRLAERWKRWSIPAAACVTGLAVAAVYDLGAPKALEYSRIKTSSRKLPAIPRVKVAPAELCERQRTTQQPGSVCAFESVDLFSMVSGYLKAQTVDIGSRIKKGQILAVIDVPRIESLEAEALACLEQARAQDLQSQSRVKSAEAERDTAAATVAQCVADIDRLIASRKLAEANYKRIKRLSEERAIDLKVVDERKSNCESAQAAEKTGRLAAETAASQLAAANVRIEQARADVAAAKAAISMAKARLTKARVDLDYARIIAPFDGVVTRRNYHPGAYIALQSGGDQLPLLTVSRTDLMRIVVQIPDREVVFVDPGDPAVLRVDGLKDRDFNAVVSRIAEFENPKTRTMRVEIDLPNPDGGLRDGMYATVTIQLDANAKALMIPSDCIQDRTPKGAGYVFVVREGMTQRADVTFGNDDGSRVEVLSGLSPGEPVVFGGGSPLSPGVRVEVQPAG
jgi:RND family efflux transporter MFP subunit